MDKKFKTQTRILNDEKLYKLKVGNIDVEMEYLENGKKLNDCVLNILKQKSEEK